MKTRDTATNLYKKLLQAWNDQDAKTYASLFSAEGNVVGFDGSQMDGAQTVEDTLSTIFAHHTTNPYVSVVREVRQLSDDVHILRAVAGMEFRGENKLNVDANVIQTMVTKKYGDDWKIELFQNTPAALHGRPEMVQQLTEELTQELHKIRS